jgi:transcriptional regulator with XRE-family HTH domain
MNRTEFGELVSTLRQDLGWTQSELAEYSGLDDPVISQIERGVKKFFEPNLLFCLANAFQLTTLERREFFFAASGLEENQIVRQPAKGTTTDTFHPSKIIDHLIGIMAQLQVPAFLTDVYGDAIAVNTAIIRFFNVPTGMIESASSIPAGYNTMRITFNKELVGRTHVADNWDAYAMSAMLTYRASTLRYRAKPYFKYLMKIFRNPVEYPLFDRFWKRVSSLEQDRITNSDLFAYRHEVFGEIKYLTAGITTTTSFGELFLATYQALDDHTSKIFSSLMEGGRGEIIRLAPWPMKTMS